MSSPDHATECRPESIGRFLEQQLSDSERCEFESHLESCEACQLRLNTETADDDWWKKAGEHLKDDVSDMLPLAAMCETTETARATNSEQNDAQNNLRFIQSWLAPTDDPEMVGRLGTYEIVGVIGAGGMGMVLKGFDRALNRYVAIKVLSPHLASSGSARQRFAREAQAAAAVVHDNVVAIHGVSEFNGLPYLVMPYVRGTSLQRRINDNGPLTAAEILRIGMQSAKGLAAAHAQGLVHRDIKPANILLDGSTERVLITDFGLARAVDDASLTHSGVVPGTPFYMSPEQAKGEAIDHRSDLFSMGSVLYAMSTGRPPFRAGTSYGILRRVAESSAHSVSELNADIPLWLDGIIRKLHEKSPEKRFQSAEELARVLSECLAHVQHPAKHALPEAVESLSTKRLTRSWRLWIAGSVVAVLAIVVAVVVSGGGQRNNDETSVDGMLRTGAVASDQGVLARDASRDVSARDDSNGELILPESVLEWDGNFDTEVMMLDSTITRLEAELEMPELSESAIP